MEEPSPRRSRLVIAGALAAAMVVGGGGFLLGRHAGGPAQTMVVPPVAPAEPPPAPEAEQGRGLLHRADLIALAAAAADAAASGRPPAPETAQADGRRFELRLPFGCDGPTGPDDKAAMGWRDDPNGRALRIDATPVTWTAADWGAEAGAEEVEVEAIEGFWIARPWTASEQCPAAGRPAATGPAPAQQAPTGPAPARPAETLALGQVFFADSGRGGRRNGEAYRTTLRVTEAGLDTSRGFRLRISGRISAARGFGPVRCRQPDGAEQRPVCLLSVVLDEVAVENPATGETLATWNVDGSDRPGN